MAPFFVLVVKQFHLQALLMKSTICSLIFGLLLFGCRQFEPTSTVPETKTLYLPKWSFLAKASATFAQEQNSLPKRAYVFPALRLDAQGQAVDQLSHRQLAGGSLSWHSAAPLGAELKALVEQKLNQLGFKLITFGELTAATNDHRVSVFNLYYAEASASRDNPQALPAESWTTFTRISAATFPQDLNPTAKRELMNQELVTLFNDKRRGPGVVKRSHRFLLDYVGANRQWSESINLLD
jgi:hypothetical protein